MDNIIIEKSFNFAIRIVNLNKYLTKEKNEYVLSKQILKSGTSIGANVSEAQNAQSKNDFVSKMCIARKETTETKYWLNLLVATQYISETEYNSLFKDADEIYRIITSIIMTTEKE